MREENVDTCSGYNMSKKPATNSSRRTVNSNYFAPLQTIDDDDNDETILEPAVR